MKSEVQSPKSKLNTLAYVALGSNLGDSRNIIRHAMDRLQELSDQPLRRSSLWQTTPVDCPPSSALFVNAVVALASRPRETPESLLRRLKALEQEFGRSPKTKLNEPRPLDLDLIAFGRETRASPPLILPHPRAHRRRFVLAPLDEIAPGLVLPGQPQSVRQLLAQLDSSERAWRLPD